VWIDREALMRHTIPRIVVGVLALVHFVVLGVACCRSAMQPQPELMGSTDIPAYDRSEWGRWTDADKDCQDARQETLIAEALEPPVLDERGCKVLSGRWRCPYTGNVITDPGLLDIDHVVALREAHVSGGWSWSRDKKRAYFSDLTMPNNLIAVDRSANRSKGSKTPIQWLPENVAFRCTYLKSWVMLKRHYGLDMTCAESEGIAELMADHCN
jgi:hypothetical protein